MKKLNVLIVDDEILAITHLKGLVPWERLGFEIVGETVHPIKGLELAKTLNPDLIFVDIKMPAMDGLTFIRKAMEEGSAARFVVLTAYKEFDYAQKSLKLNVHDYWVKHELTPEGLTRELLNIREDIAKAKRLRRKICKPILMGLLQGHFPSNEDLKTLHEFLGSYGRQYFVIVLDTDDPFPVLEEEESAPAAQEPFLSEDAEILEGWHAVETFSLDGRQQAVLLAAKGVVSRLQMTERLFEASRILKTEYGKRMKPFTVSAAFSAELTDIRKLGETVDRLRKRLRYRIFIGMNRIIPDHIDNLRVPDQTVQQAIRDIQRGIHTVDARLENHDVRKIREQIGAIFAAVKQSGQPSVLAHACRGILEVLDRFRERNGLAPVKDEPNVRSDGAKRWTTIDGIAGWFSDMIEQSLNESLTGQYSFHVRETIRFIHRHYAQDVSIDQIAANLGISGDHLRHCFKAETGKTVLEYLTKVRIEKAKAYLKEHHCKLYEVAAKVGYRNSHYFSKVFQKETGMHPLDYRKGSRSE